MTVCGARWSTADAAHEHMCEQDALHDVHLCACGTISKAGMFVDPDRTYEQRLEDARAEREAKAEVAVSIKFAADRLARAVVDERRNLLDGMLMDGDHPAVTALDRMASELLAMSAGAHRVMMEAGRA